MKLYWKHIICAFSLIFCASCSGSHQSLPGYIEGEYTYISSTISGKLFNLFVKRGQNVRKGELLYELDPQPEKANVAVTEANIEDLKAQVAFSKVQLLRQKNLFEHKATPKADLDRAQTDFDSKSKQLAATESNLINTQWRLQQKTLYAPISGQVFDTFYRVGETVQDNHPVLAILAPQNIKVLFYIPEPQLHKIKIGQSITFSCDSCQGKINATVSYISPEAEYTPPVIYSKDTRYKLVYLIRADMPENVAKHFHPGQPIDVYLQP